jgi:hypothetical protein
LSARLELHLRADVAGGQLAAPSRDLFLCPGHFRHGPAAAKKIKQMSNRQSRV